MSKRMLWIPCLALAAAALAWLVAPRLHRFAYWIDHKTGAEVDALATDGWQVDRLQVAPDVTLVGLVRPPQAPAARWILFVPGNSTALLAGFRAELDRLRGDADVGLAFWAYRGFEASGGTPTPPALADDLLRQWERLRELGATPDRTEVWGYSLGAPLAVQLAARLGERGQGPRRLVLAAAAPRISVMRHGLFGRFLPDDDYDATAALAAVPCPTVVVHGTDDDALPIDGARALAAALGARATLHELPGKGHLDLWDDLRRLVF
jgi:pimeloyl-ACP methyl ester carboxylesterase